MSPVGFLALLWAIELGFVAGAVLRSRRTRRDRDRNQAQWALAGGLAGIGLAGVTILSRATTGTPASVGAWVAIGTAATAVGLVLGSLRATGPRGAAALTGVIVAGGLALLLVGALLAVLLAQGRAPTATERSVVTLSLLVALVVAVLVNPVRRRLTALADRMTGRRRAHASQALESFGARMTRAVPMDELLLQLCENLHATIASSGAEVWTGTQGHLTLAVSVPHRAAESLELGERARDVVGRARVSGNAWLAMWVPALLRTEPQRVRFTPAAHQGELLGLVVVRRDPDSAFTDDDDAILATIGRQLGLALHNVRLDSALQDSLERLQTSYRELQDSRARVVGAADASRRRIERDLHDGAQQHLVSIAVRLGLVASLIEPDSPVAAILAELRSETQAAIDELRELAHGIYPPLLRQRGLAEALRAAATRNALDPVVEVALPQRYSESIETAVYFCCLEAMQNAAKHAGPRASLNVCVRADEGSVSFEVRDDGVGFADSHAPTGSGFVNMRDRLGSVGGTLTVTSSPGEGTRVTGIVPARPHRDEPT